MKQLFQAYETLASSVAAPASSVAASVSRVNAVAQTLKALGISYLLRSATGDRYDF